MLVLKHLAREADVDPYKLRRMLRAKYGKAPKGSWRWQTRNKDYESKLRFVLQHKQRMHHA